MWSLPDINRLNSRAADPTSKASLQNAVETGYLNGNKLTCEHEDERCTDELYRELYYDIFSDDPKGILTQCSHHKDYYGSEGYFRCEDCHRLMVENYTWEYYWTTTEDGELLCLPCAAKRYIADDDNWITLTPESIAALDFERVRKAKHVIGVRMPVPKTITYVDNVEMDSSTGGKLRTTMYADPTPNAAVEELRAVLMQALEDGHKRALLILDAAYQFSVSIGVYVDSDNAAAAA
jgi:hypothetical protein